MGTVLMLDQRRLVASGRVEDVQLSHYLFREHHPRMGGELGHGHRAQPIDGSGELEASRPSIVAPVPVFVQHVEAWCALTP